MVFYYMQWCYDTDYSIVTIVLQQIIALRYRQLCCDRLLCCVTYHSVVFETIVLHTI